MSEPARDRAALLRSIAVWIVVLVILGLLAVQAAGVVLPYEYR